MSDQILKEILGELKTINQRVGGLEEGQKDLKSGFAEIRTDVSGLKTDVSELRTDVSGLKTDVSELSKGQLRLETRMENEVIEKIRALFDARQAGEERLDQINGRLGNIETDTGYLVARVAQLEKAAR